MTPDWKRLEQVARAEVQATLEQLPPPLRDRATALPVTFAPAPSAALVAEGIEPDTLGLFSGPALDEEIHCASPVPAQIFLYWENLWDQAEGDIAAYRAEVRTTYLHELGHYLGLDEDDLTERGLD